MIPNSGRFALSLTVSEISANFVIHNLLTLTGGDFDFFERVILKKNKFVLIFSEKNKMIWIFSEKNKMF